MLYRGRFTDDEVDTDVYFPSDARYLPVHHPPQAIDEDPDGDRSVVEKTVNLSVADSEINRSSRSQVPCAAVLKNKSYDLQNQPLSKQTCDGKVRRVSGATHPHSHNVLACDKG
jgi:hypothetical protein